jgi:hypothetical protein
MQCGVGGYQLSGGTSSPCAVLKMEGTRSTETVTSCETTLCQPRELWSTSSVTLVQVFNGDPLLTRVRFCLYSEGVVIVCFHPENGGGRVLRNDSNHTQDHAMLQLRRALSKLSTPC